jgi:hypothetical protein
LLQTCVLHASIKDDVIAHIPAATAAITARAMTQGLC